VRALNHKGGDLIVKHTESWLQSINDVNTSVIPGESVEVHKTQNVILLCLKAHIITLKAHIITYIPLTTQTI